MSDLNSLAKEHLILAAAQDQLNEQNQILKQRLDDLEQTIADLVRIVLAQTGDDDDTNDMVAA